MTNLMEKKCEELRLMARDLGIKGYGNKGKAWLVPQIEAVLLRQEQERKAAEEAAKKATTEKKARNVNLIEFDGKSQSIGAWARELGMPVSTLRARIRNGWPIEKMLTTASNGKSEKLIEFNGKKQTLSAWAKELGLPRATLDARINRMLWPYARALKAND